MIFLTQVNHFLAATSMPNDEHFMRLALREAHKARAKGEIPIGCVIVQDDKVLARGHNLKESRHDATCHAEIVALRKAYSKLQNWRLSGCTLYVTLEPCPMCLSAIIQSRISKVVFGAADRIMGACGSKTDLTRTHEANPTIEISGGILAPDCKAMIDSFWQHKRKSSF